LGRRPAISQKPRKKVFSVLTRSQKDHSRLVDEIGARRESVDGARHHKHRARTSAPLSHRASSIGPP
jgi:hypothetical protein